MACRTPCEDEDVRNASLLSQREKEAEKKQTHWARLYFQPKNQFEKSRGIP